MTEDGKYLHNRHPFDLDSNMGYEAWREFKLDGYPVCIEDLTSGGENALLNHEIAYIHLRDTNPDYIRFTGCGIISVLLIRSRM